MIFWILTSIRLEPAASLPASTIQNLLTAIHLARAGHQVIVWTNRLSAGWQRMIEQHLGLPLPPELHLIQTRSGGPEGEKKTQFDSLGLRMANLAKALRIAPPPDAIISRSPRAIEQIRKTRLVSPRRKLILEYQYPEWAQLWRSWRSRNPHAPLSDCVKRLRTLKRAEMLRLHSCTGILYAAKAHERLLREAQYKGLADLLPSGCLEPDEDPPEVLPEYDCGYVGALRPENGVHVLLEAVLNLPEARVLIAGDGPENYLARLQTLASRAGQQQVVFAGRIPFGDVRQTMRKCRIGVVPVSARHGAEKRQYASPLKLVEWCAAGVPVVASSVPSVMQTIDPANNMSIVRPDDPDALAAALKNLMDHPMERERIRRNAIFLGQLMAFPNRAARIEAFVRRLR